MPRLHAIARGMVQGVFFRATALEEARARGLSGWVRNRRDGGVEVCAEGAAEQLKSFRDWFAHGPPGAVVQDVEEIDEPATGEFHSFYVTT
jgi:acylphosphatase